jgi:adenylate kinase family enzyme
MQRIAVIGCGGSGKSHFARRLGARLGLPVVHLDQYYWQPGWVATDLDTFRRRVAELAAADRWIMDGNFSHAYPERLPRADTIIWFDMPRWRCILGVVRRILLGFGRTRSDMTEGCPERISIDLLLWVWVFPKRHRPRVEKGIAEYGGRARLVHFQSRRDAKRFLASLPRPATVTDALDPVT